MLLIFSVLFIIPGEAKAERFFQKNSTWYEPIAVNPTPATNSANYVNDIRINSDSFATVGGVSGEYAVPIWHAEASTPITTVPVEHPTHKSYIEAQGWNQVPIPAGALPSGNTALCTGAYRDGSMVVISHDGKYAWDFFHAKYCNGQWSSYYIRKWDLTTDGVNFPYDGRGSARSIPMPLLHGLTTYNEVANEGAINHAMTFVYWGDCSATHETLYPGVWPVGGLSSRPWCLKLGERFYLNRSYDCSTVTSGTHNLAKQICIALQEYGMIFVENTGAGFNGIYLEDLDNQPYSWSGIYNGDLALQIGKGNRNNFWNNLNLIDPIYPSQTTGDTQAPTVPAGVTATAISYSQINLSWTASTDPAITGQATSGVTGYKVFRNGSQIATVTTTSYTNTGLTASTSYSYTVSAYDAAGNVSSQSVAASATTNSDAATPAAPQGLLVQ